MMIWFEQLLWTDSAAGRNTARAASPTRTVRASAATAPAALTGAWAQHPTLSAFKANWVWVVVCLWLTLIAWAYHYL